MMLYFWFVKFLFLSSFVDCNTFVDKVFVLDDVLSDDSLRGILELLKEEDVLWKFRDVASGEREDPEIYKSALPVKSSHCWTSRLVPSQFTDGDRQSQWAVLRRHVIENFALDEISLLMHRVEAQISSRGDSVVSVRHCSSDSEDDVLVVLFLVPKWEKNSHGEMVIYGKNGEILKSIHPKSGRAIILSCKNGFVIKPPSMDFQDRLRTIVFHVSSTNASQMKPVFTKEEQKQNIQKMYELHSFQPLNSIAFDKSKLDISKHITRQFITAKGHPILVFDNMISPEILSVTADTMLNGFYTDNPPEENSEDSVPWILGFDVQALVESPLWHYAKAVVEFATKNNGYFPYDVSCNSIRSYDTTKVHRDCDPDQDEYTMLIYLNRNWTDNNHGETIFFDYDRKEMVFAVKPKFGRITIFQGTIPHSARPPSPKVHGPRFTLAVKFAASKEEALSKTFNLNVEPILEYQMTVEIEEQERIEKILKDIKSGIISKSEVENIVRHYEKKLKQL